MCQSGSESVILLFYNKIATKVLILFQLRDLNLLSYKNQKKMYQREGSGVWGMTHMTRHDNDTWLPWDV